MNTRPLTLNPREGPLVPASGAVFQHYADLLYFRHGLFALLQKLQRLLMAKPATGLPDHFPHDRAHHPSGLVISPEASVNVSGNKLILRWLFLRRLT